MKLIRLLLLVCPFFTQAASSADAAPDQPVDVIFETSEGTFTLELWPDKAPKTVDNFLAYVDDGFYNDTIFHRVIQDFVIQGGGFDRSRKPKETRAPIKNESANLLKNTTGTVSMARRTHPDTATSQFFINLTHNDRLDYKSKYEPGYTVFGRVSQGMDVIQRISEASTMAVDLFRNLPQEDIVILSAKRKAPPLTQAKAGASAGDGGRADVSAAVDDGGEAALPEQELFVLGEHYVQLERPVPTRNNDKIEVVEMFSYGCPHCYEFEAMIREWNRQQAGDVDFWVMPAVWNKPMALYARAFYTARELNVSEIIHHPLFTAIVIEQRKISNEKELEEFFARYGVERQAFKEAFHSSAVTTQVKHAEERVRLYKPMGVPEIVVNGKYRIGRMGAGGLAEMLPVLDFLVKKERAGSEGVSALTPPE